MKNLIEIIIKLFNTLFNGKATSAPDVGVANPSYPPILDKVYDMGFEVISHGDYHLNLIGIRTKTKTPNKFDDHLSCLEVAEFP